MDHATPTRPQYQLFVGVDIAAVTATVAWMPPGGTPSRPITIDQTQRGFASLQQRLLAGGHQPAAVLVALEATGSYWIGLATNLAEAGFAVSVVNPAQAHTTRCTSGRSSVMPCCGCRARCATNATPSPSTRWWWPASGSGWKRSCRR